MEVKKNKNIRISKYSNDELVDMDILDIYKLLLHGDITRFPPGTWERPEAIENSLKCMTFLIDDILKWDLEDVKSKIRMRLIVKYKLGGMMQKLYRNSPYEILSKIYGDKIMPWELHEAPTKIWDKKSNRLAAMDWLINTKLKWTKDDIREKYNGQVLVDNNLGGLLSEGGKGSSYLLLNEFMEDEFKPWELKASSTPLNFWRDKNNRVFAIRDLFENILHWDKDDIKRNLNQDVFKKHNLFGLLSCYYEGSPYKALEEVYPGEFLPWELAFVPSGFWDVKENRVKAVRWLFDVRLKWSIEDIKNKVSQKAFIDNGLISILAKASMYTLISDAYPNEFYEWQLPVTTPLFWKVKENRINALDHLFKERLNWTIEDIKKNFNQKVLIDNGYVSLLNYHNGSPYKVLLEYLPEDSFKAWELPNVPIDFWKDDANCVDAIKWIIKKLNINSKNINTLTRNVLSQHNIVGVVNFKYNKSMKKFKEDLINYL